MAEHLDVQEFNNIELYDENDESISFTCLDAMMLNEKLYLVLAHECADENGESPEDHDHDHEDDEYDCLIYIMSVATGSDADGEYETLEVVTDELELQEVFDEFRRFSGDEYDVVED